ncbi:MAG TPA: RHS repeat-associated core domain-containing protein [Candidatus Binatia bacterium]|nr:RHS repeat-associated core domain-containing protein [Candidatus Binatia bacterium]
MTSTNLCSGSDIQHWKLPPQEDWTWNTSAQNWVSSQTNNDCWLHPSKTFPNKATIERSPTAVNRTVTVTIVIEYYYWDVPTSKWTTNSPITKTVNFDITDQGSSCGCTANDNTSTSNTTTTSDDNNAIQFSVVETILQQLQNLMNQAKNQNRSHNGAPFKLPLKPVLGRGALSNKGRPVVKLPLGQISAAQDGGVVMLDTQGATGSLSDPALLSVPYVRSNATAFIETITNGSAIQQVNAPDGLVNVAVINQYKYLMQMFYAQNVTGKGTNGLYGTNAAAFVTWTIENPDGAVTNNRLRATESRPGAADRQFTYLKTNISGVTTWQLTDGASLQTSLSWEQQDTNNPTLTNAFEVTQSGSAVLKKVQKVYDLVDGRRVLKQQIEGDGNVTNATTSTYGTNNLVQRIDYPNGRWEYFVYDNANRVITNYSAYSNFTNPPAGSIPDPSTYPCKITSYSYNSVSGDDHVALQTSVARQETVALPVFTGSVWTNQEVSRIYRSVPEIDEVEEWRCADPGASFGDSANLLTTTVRFLDDSDQTTYGQIKWQLLPDGTASIYNYQEGTNRVVTNLVVQTGQPNDTFNPTNVLEGVQVETTFNSVGQITSTTTKYITGGTASFVLSRQTNIYSGPLQTDYQTTDLANLTNQFYFDCCGLSSTVDPDGVTTVFDYDSLKRRVAAITLRGGATGVKMTNILDSAGRVLETRRIGTNGSSITLADYQYDVLGRTIRETNALGGVTTHTNVTANGRLCVTNTYPDGGTRIETYCTDGRLESVSGTAVSPITYLYGAEQDGASGPWREFTLQIKPDASGHTNEWVKTYSDGLGRAYKTVYAAAGAPYPYSQSLYNGLGQLWMQVDPDGVTTLYTYNAKGEQEYAINAISDTALAIADYGTLLSSLGTLQSGTDRITRTVNDVYTNSAYGTTVLRTSTYVWSTNSSAYSNLVSVSESSADGFRSWQTSYADANTPLTSQGRTLFTNNGNRYATNTAPDGSSTVSSYHYGLPISSTALDSQPSVLASSTNGYDAYDRRSSVTDARNGTTSYSFNGADQTGSVTTPNPGSIGGSPQTTLTFYDQSLRTTNIVDPDGTGITNEFYLTGQLKRTYGSRTYPVAYSYDAQGRMKTMTNWSSFVAGAGTRVTTWNYDTNRGWLISKTYDGGTPGPTYTNTPAGRLGLRIWARGTNTVYTYNRAGQLAATTYSDSTPALSYVYDRRGRQSAFTNGSSVCLMTHNDAGSLLSESWLGGTLGGLSISNTYDQFLRRTHFAGFNGSTQLVATVYSYDAASRLKTVTASTNSATYSYVANSSLVGQILFTNSGTLRMTTSKQYDFLNRLTSISSSSSQLPSPISYAYLYNNANQRIQTILADGSRWIYEYDPLGQVRSAKRYWADWTPVAGQQFEYAFDDIGNRTSTKAGGDGNGWNLRSASYSANNLNQYTNRDFPGTVDVLGVGFATNAITVNSQTAYRYGEYFWSQVSSNNTSAPIYPQVTVTEGATNVSGNVFMPKTTETFTYDADGNLTSDGRWTNTWDAENRLVFMAPLGSVPYAAQYQLTFEYDYQGRRIKKNVAVSDGSGGFTTGPRTHFLYDGWNLVAETDNSSALLRSYVWGNDLSGSLQGAGGVGGLLIVADQSTINSQPSTHFVSYDGNGDVSALVNAADGTASANYEYGPFGEAVRSTGPMAKANAARFSTKYYEDESGFSYYGYRFYNASPGRFEGRDPVQEAGGINLYSPFSGDPINRIDTLGLCGGGGGAPHCDVQSFSITSRKWTGNLPTTWAILGYSKQLKIRFQLVLKPGSDTSLCRIRQNRKGEAHSNAGSWASKNWVPDGGDWWDGSTWWEVGSWSGLTANFEDEPGIIGAAKSDFPVYFNVDFYTFVLDVSKPGSPEVAHLSWGVFIYYHSTTSGYEISN